jgi:hypothetical protein
MADGDDATAALAEQNDALLAALEAQSADLARLQTDVTALRQSVEARAASPQPQPDPAAALGALGTLLGGGALAVMIYRRRGQIAPPEPNE